MLDIIWGKIDLPEEHFIIVFDKIPRELLQNDEFIDFISNHSYNKAVIYEFVKKYITFFKDPENYKNKQINNRIEYIKQNFKLINIEEN